MREHRAPHHFEADQDDLYPPPDLYPDSDGRAESAICVTWARFSFGNGHDALGLILTGGPMSARVAAVFRLAVRP
jgi:hypothetical protein